MPTTDTPPTVADLLARHLDLHQQIVKHRVVPTVDVDIDEDTGRPYVASYDGHECTGCEWMVDRSASPTAECPDRSRLRKEINQIVAELERLRAEPRPVEAAA